MKPATLRSGLLCALLALPLATASANSAATDQAALTLVRHGTIPLSAAGPYVAPGTFQIQVAAKLGRPDARLADGTWLYHHHRVAHSAAVGTLVVRFGADHRVSSLALATPAAVAALREPRESGRERLAAH